MRQLSVDAERPIGVPVADLDEPVRRRLADLVATERSDWAAAGADRAEPLAAVEELLTHGKHVRSRLCLWGFAGARQPGVEAAETPPGDVPAAVDAAAAVELLHASALLHDDVMDGSPTRRGRPAAHARFAAEHAAAGLSGDPARFGTAMAVLAGDLALTLAFRLAATLPAPARPVWDRLICDLTVGQFLDVAGTARRHRDQVTAARVARLKSGRYSVEGPLLLGAATAGGDERVAAAYAGYGRPLGEAFQLRDDLLGVFGDPDRTGKPAGEDLRDGKPTLLVAIAQQRCDRRQRRLLERVGSPDLDAGEVARITALLRHCGAVDAVERRIVGLVDEAVVALDAAPLSPPVVAELRRTAAELAWRSA